MPEKPDGQAPTFKIGKIKPEPVLVSLKETSNKFLQAFEVRLLIRAPLVLTLTRLQALQGHNKLEYSILDFHGLILSALKSEQNLHIFSKLFNQTFSSLQKEGFGVGSEFDSYGLRIHISW